MNSGQGRRAAGRAARRFGPGGGEAGRALEQFLVGAVGAEAGGVRAPAGGGATPRGGRHPPTGGPGGGGWRPPRRQGRGRGGRPAGAAPGWAGGLGARGRREGQVGEGVVFHNGEVEAVEGPGQGLAAAGVEDPARRVVDGGEQEGEAGGGGEGGGPRGGGGPGPGGGAATGGPPVPGRRHRLDGRGRPGLHPPPLPPGAG